MPSEQVPRGTEKIMLIDDERVLCDMITDMLDSLGYQVTAFTDGMKALMVFKSDPDDFDLIITDQTMPIITGIELAGEVLQIRNDIPIVLCTGYSKEVDESRCLQAGIKAFCLKPLRLGEIATKIRAVLD